MFKCEYSMLFYIFSIYPHTHIMDRFFFLSFLLTQFWWLNFHSFLSVHHHHHNHNHNNHSKVILTLTGFLFLFFIWHILFSFICFIHFDPNGSTFAFCLHHCVLLYTHVQQWAWWWIQFSRFFNIFQSKKKKLKLIRQWLLCQPTKNTVVNIMVSIQW